MKKFGITVVVCSLIAIGFFAVRLWRVKESNRQLANITQASAQNSQKPPAAGRTDIPVSDSPAAEAPGLEIPEPAPEMRKAPPGSGSGTGMLLDGKGAVQMQFALSFNLTPEQVAGLEQATRDAQSKLAAFKAQYATWEPPDSERMGLVVVPPFKEGAAVFNDLTNKISAILGPEKYDRFQAGFADQYLYQFDYFGQREMDWEIHFALPAPDPTKQVPLFTYLGSKQSDGLSSPRALMVNFKTVQDVYSRYPWVNKFESQISSLAGQYLNQ